MQTPPRPAPPGTGCTKRTRSRQHTRPDGTARTTPRRSPPGSCPARTPRTPLRPPGTSRRRHHQRRHWRLRHRRWYSPRPRSRPRPRPRRSRFHHWGGTSTRGRRGWRSCSSGTPGGTRRMTPRPRQARTTRRCTSRTPPDLRGPGRLRRGRQCTTQIGGQAGSALDRNPRKRCTGRSRLLCRHRHHHHHRCCGCSGLAHKHRT